MYTDTYQVPRMRSILDADYNRLPFHNILHLAIRLSYKVGAPFYDILLLHCHKTCGLRDILDKFDRTFHHMNSSALLLDNILAPK